MIGIIYFCYQGDYLVRINSKEYLLGLMGVWIYVRASGQCKRIKRIMISFTQRIEDQLGKYH